jgi:regulator of replication initiation timing
MKFAYYICFLCGICLLSGCKNKEQEQILNKLRTDYKLLTDEMHSKDSTLAELQQKVEIGSKQLKEIQGESGNLKGQIDQMRQENDNLRKEAETLKKEFEEYKNKYKISARMRFRDHQMERLALKTGAVYEKVTIKNIEDDRISILHSSGTTRIAGHDLDSDLAEKLGIFKSSVQSVQTDEEDAVAQIETLPAWSPSGIDDVAECSLMVWVTSVTPQGTVSNGAGSAFLCNIGEYTYIYTNAHNLDGAIKVEFKHANGKTVNDFAQMEIAKSPFGYNKKYGYGGDVVRIQLKNYRQKALTLATNDINLQSLKDCPVYITGNTKGRGEITKLDGKITEILERNILNHNVPTQSGNSGSPIVRANDCKVIGILTWGRYDDENPFLSLWSKQPDEIREGINSGPLLYDFVFEKTSLERLRKQRLCINEIRKLARMLGLLDALVPAHTGLFVNPSDIVSGDYTVRDILEESADHNVIKFLVAFDRKLAVKAGSKIPYSNRTILDMYHKAMKTCVKEIVISRINIENDVGHLHYFFKRAVDKSNVLKVCHAYESAMGEVLAWYEKQASLSGEPLPLRERVRLPNINGGFAKYLKEE